MKKLLITLLVLLIVTACGGRGPSKPTADQGHNVAVAADNNARLSLLNTAQADKIAVLSDKVALLESALATKENERLLYEAAFNDSQTLNALVLWRAFGWPAMLIGGGLLLLFVAVCIVAFGLLRSMYVSKLSAYEKRIERMERSQADMLKIIERHSNQKEAANV